MYLTSKVRPYHSVAQELNVPDSGALITKLFPRTGKFYIENEITKLATNFLARAVEMRKHRER
jgi:hypothetical protein